MSLSPTLALACELIRRPSVTPLDADCQQLMMQRLAACGFDLEPMRIEEVDNFWARRAGRDGGEGPVLCFAGHTDVVPTGPEQAWQHLPFDAQIDADGMLCGRGAADMKGSLAAMIIATERFVAEHPDHRGSIAYLITSDEEGPAQHGTKAVVERLRARNERLDWCIVGEPSSTTLVGDVVKNGRRGSLGATLKVRGVPTTMLRFAGEYHGTGSKPSNFMRTQLYMMSWYKRYRRTSPTQAVRADAGRQ